MTEVVGFHAIFTNGDTKSYWLRDVVKKIDVTALSVVIAFDTSTATYNLQHLAGYEISYNNKGTENENLQR